MIAVHQGNEKIVRMLLEYGADPLLVDRFGKRAVDRTKDPRIIGLLNAAAFEEDSVNSKHYKQKKEEVLKSYKEKIKEELRKETKNRLRLLNNQVKESAKNQLEAAETPLRKEVKRHISELTAKMNTQINQHLKKKIKEATKLEGHTEERKGLPLTERTKFPVKALKKVSTPEKRQSIKPNKDSFKSNTEKVMSPKTIHNINNIPTKVHIELKPELTKYMNQKLEELCKRLAEENKSLIDSIVESKLDELRKELKENIGKSVNNWGRIVKESTNKAINDWMKYAQKDKKDEEDYSEDRFADLKRSIKRLDKDYANMAEIASLQKGNLSTRMTNAPVNCLRCGKKPYLMNLKEKEARCMECGSVRLYTSTAIQTESQYNQVLDKKENIDVLEDIEGYDQSP